MVLNFLVKNYKFARGFLKKYNDKCVYDQSSAYVTRKTIAMKTRHM